MDRTKDELMNAATLASVTTTLVYIQAQLAEIKADVKTLTNIFASKEELAQSARVIDDRINRLESASNLWRWLSPTMSAVLSWIIGSVITFLVIQYIQHYK